MNKNRRFALVLRVKESYGFEKFKIRDPFWSGSRGGLKNIKGRVGLVKQTKRRGRGGKSIIPDLSIIRMDVPIKNIDNRRHMICL